MRTTLRREVTVGVKVTPGANAVLNLNPCIVKTCALCPLKERG